MVFLRMRVNKKGELTVQEILEIVLAGAAVLVMGFLLFKLIAPSVDVNKEYAEGVYVKLEQAAAEMEDSGVGKFNILDIPVDYGDSVFLVLFKGERTYVSLSKYPVEIKNSGFSTYAKKSAVPLLMSGRRGYYSLFTGAGVEAGVAGEASSEVAERVAFEAAKTMEDVIFEIDLRHIIEDFVSTSKVEGLDSKKIVQEMLDAGVGKGLSPEGKINALKGALGKYVPEGGKVGRYTNIDTFMSKAEALARAKGKTMATLTKDVGFNIDAENFIKNYLGDDEIAQRAYKEFTDETFGKGLKFGPKKDALRNAIIRNADDISGLDSALKKISDRTSREVVEELAEKGTREATDDLLRAATNKILAVRSIPADDVTEGIIKTTLVGKRVGTNVVGKVISASKGKLMGLSLRVAGKVLVVGFLVWEIHEYYNVAQKTQEWVITALNNDEVSANEWVVGKLLQAEKGESDVLCVCYVDDDYRKNYCSDCVDFGKPIVTNPADENRWTFCEDITLEERRNEKGEDEILLTSVVKDDCRPSIALTNDECEDSAEALAESLDTIGNDIIGSTTAVVSSTSYGMLTGAIGGCLVGFLFAGPPGCVVAGAAGLKMGAAGGTLAGTYSAYKGVEFDCDSTGHIYLKGDR
jgi:hypothetical protein